MSTAPDVERFRSVLGHVPTPVVIVAGLDALGEPAGLTIGSFTSVSLRPPLVGFFVDTNSRTWASIEPSGRYCVNVLAAGQTDLCWRFAKESVDRFVGVEWSAAPSGAPIIAGVAAWIDCSVASVTEHGDHVLVTGRVEHLEVAAPVEAPMVFHRGRATGLADAG